MNPNVKDVQNVGQILGGDVWSFANGNSAKSGLSNYYRPMQILSYAGEYAVFGERPWGWHAVNVALNVAVVIAAYLLIASLGGAELALWTALLFALHPMHIEAVAWIAAVPELECGLMLLVAMIFYHRARMGEWPPGNLAISALAFLAALFSKETALLFPVILLSYEYFYRGVALGRLWRSIRWIWPHLLALQVYVIARMIALGAFAPIYQAAREPLTGVQLLLAIPAVLARYVAKLVAPIRMNYFYAFPIPKSFGWWTVIGFAVTAILVTGMFALRKSQPLLAFAVAWFLLTLAPALSLNRIGENFFTERYLYIPSLGFCVFVAWGWLQLLQRLQAGPGRWVAWGAGAALLVFYVMQVERRIPVFRDNLTLLSDAVAKSPDSGAVNADLAAALFDHGEYDNAIEHMTLSLNLRPHHEISLLKLAQYFSAEKRYDEAIERLKEATELHPEYDVAWINLAKAYTEKGDWQQAAACYRQLQELDSQHVNYYQQLARMAEANGLAVDDVPRAEKAAEDKPHDAAALVHLSDVYARTNRWTDAAAMLRRATKEKPKNVEIWTKLGICLDQTGDRPGAIDAYEHAISTDPGFLLARKYLARSLAAAGRTDESSAQLDVILAKNPNYEHADEVHYELGLNLEKKGDSGSAAREYAKALQANPHFADARTRLEALDQASGKSSSK